MANNNPNTNIAYNAFLNKYVELYEIHFPLLTIKRSDKKFPRKQWITPGLIKSCNKKSKLYKQYINNPNEKNEKKFKNYQKNLKKLLIKAEKQYYSQKIKNYGSNLTKLWKTIKTLINKKTPSFSQTTFISNGVEYNNNSSIVEKFNNYFCNIGPTLAASIPPASTSYDAFLSGSYINSFGLIPASCNEILDVTKNFETKNSAGYDNVSTKIMKSSINQIVEPLCSIINNSFSNGIVPHNLKIAKVCPVLKCGSPELFNNYRPISLLPGFSKIFEKLVYNRLINYLNSRNILSLN